MLATSIAPPVIAVRFVKSTQAAITLDFVVPDDHTGPPIERYELQWREAEWGADGMDDGAAWTTASNSLRLGRCTKSGLKSGHSYAFRARACAGPGDRWGPFG